MRFYEEGFVDFGLILLFGYAVRVAESIIHVFDTG